MSGGIFLLSGEQLVEMREQAYDSEDLLQAWLAKYPSLLSGDDQLADSPRRWLLVKREAGIPDREAGGDRWALDHLFIDQEAVPTLVEVKRGDDTRIRRDLYPELASRWAANYKQWNWAISSLETIPDLGPAIELTRRYQPSSGPMPIPMS